MTVIVSPQGWTGSWSNVTGTTGTFTGSGSYAGKTFSLYTPVSPNSTCYLPYAFDNNITYGFGTIWQAAGLGNYFTITYDAPVKIESYELWSGYATYITAWNLQGSSDGVNYTIIDNGNSSVDTIGTSFTVDSPSFYKYYRFFISGSIDSYWMTVNELKLYGFFETIINGLQKIPHDSTKYSNNSVELINISNRNRIGSSLVGNPRDISPLMTSNNTPSPYVVSADSAYSINHTAWKVFNNSNINDYDCWTGVDGSISTPTWLKIDFNSQKNIVGYQISGYYVGGHYPTAWTLNGSNDNSNWTQLDSKTGQVLTGTLSSMYSISNTDGYRYYKFIFTATSGLTRAVVGEIKFYDKTTQKHNYIGA